MSPVQATAVLNSFPGIKQCSLLNVAVLSAEPSGFAEKFFNCYNSNNFFLDFDVLLTSLLFLTYHIIGWEKCVCRLFFLFPEYDFSVLRIELQRRKQYET